MIRNDNSISSILTNNTQSKEITNKNIINKKKTKKSVRFNNDVVVINVESYKKYNQLYSYNEEDIYNNYLMKDEYQNYYENAINTKSNHNDNIVRQMETSKRKENECCCNLF